MEYLIRFAQVHENFRRPELEALANVEDVELQILEYHSEYPYCIVRLGSETKARKLVRRSVLTLAIFELWGKGDHYEQLHEDVRRRTSKLWDQYLHPSFRFSVDCFQGSRTSAEQRNIIEAFSYLGFEGPIRMKGAEYEFVVHESYRSTGLREPSNLYLGRLIGRGGRSAVERYNLKKRKYINTTSMDSELALITANLALAASGKLCYDPFVGTASFPIACAHFGASALGSDMDGRTIRGTEGRNVLTNFEQYGLSSCWIDGFTADTTNSPLRLSKFLDAIICDPPYGVREGLKVLGRKDGAATEAVYIDGVAAHTLPGFVAPKRHYSFEALLDDVLQFASCTLVEGGRLCMWMPTANDEDLDLPLPAHPRLELVSVCIQDFNKWSRRLLTYSRLSADEVGDQEPKIRFAQANGLSANALNAFRRKFFTGFNSTREEKAAEEETSQALHT